MIGLVTSALDSVWPQSFTTFKNDLGSLSCWNIHSFGIKLFEYGRRLFLSTFFGLFIIPLMWTSGPSPLAENIPQTNTLPPPCLTVGIWYLLSYHAPAEDAEQIVCDRSQTNWISICPKSDSLSIYSRCCLAKSNRAFWFFLLKVSWQQRDLLDQHRVAVSKQCVDLLRHDFFCF